MQLLQDISDRPMESLQCLVRSAFIWSSASIVALPYYFIWGLLWTAWLGLFTVQQLLRWAFRRCPIYISPGALFAPLPNWSRFVIEQLERAADGLNRWTSTYGPVIGLWVYNWVANLPVIQFVLLGTQWGLSLQKLYTIFPIGNYWICRLRSSSAYLQRQAQPTDNTTISSNNHSESSGSTTTTDDDGSSDGFNIRRLQLRVTVKTDFGDLKLPSPAIPILYLGIQLTGLFIQRIDFVIRFVFGLIYGAYILDTVQAEHKAKGGKGKPDTVVKETREKVPILLSLVGYMDMPDNAVPPRPPVPTNNQPSTQTDAKLRKVHNPFVLADSGERGLRIIMGEGMRDGISVQDTASVIQFLVEVAWLSYEEPLVAQDVVLKHWAKLVPPGAGGKPPDVKVKVLDFVSTVYKKEPHARSSGGAAAAPAAPAQGSASGTVPAPVQNNDTAADVPAVQDIGNALCQGLACVQGHAGALLKGRAEARAKHPDVWERPLDTQCIIFTVGNAVVLAFRGSQPGSILDWFYDFSVNSLAPPNTTATPSGGSTAGKNVEGTQGGGAIQSVGRLHEGFKYNLGLPQLGEDAARAVMSEVYEYPDADHWATIGDVPVLKDSSHPVRQIPKSPYKRIKELVLQQLKDNPKRKLYVTGHSLGGALCAVFATEFAEDMENSPDEELTRKRVYLATYGQPLVGDEEHSRFMTKNLPGNHYLRVVNLNDLVGRVPTFFLDSGVSLGYAGQAWFIDSSLQLQQVPDIPAFEYLLWHQWAKLKQAWQRLGPPPGTNTHPLPSPQSSLRFLVRAALTPIMAINDHIDYKWALRNAKLPGQAAQSAAKLSQ